MVEYELLHTIHAFYPMIIIQDYVIMPEHLHAIMVVQDRIVSQNGKIQTIGQVIAGFKQGCNRRFWQIIQRTESALTLTPSLSISVSNGFADGNTRQPLFSPGYCDVMPISAAQLATQRAYIAANPRSRLLRTSNRAMLMPQRGGIDTALTLNALRGFLLRECPSHLVSFMPHKR
jgi:hypothetical protein